MDKSNNTFILGLLTLVLMCYPFFTPPDLTPLTRLILVVNFT
jgi:hypothetical protein